MEQLNNQSSSQGLYKSTYVLIALICLGIGAFIVYLFMSSQNAELKANLEAEKIKSLALLNNKSTVNLIVPPTPPLISTQTTSPQTIQPTPPNEAVIAQQVITLTPNTSFTLQNLKDVKFEILKIYKATGSVQNNNCFGGSTGIVVMTIHPSLSTGTCINSSYRIEGQKVGVVAIDFETLNNSDAEIYSRFLRLTYDVTTDNGVTEVRYAEENPKWAWYGSSPHSNTVIRLGFMVPENQNNFHLLYGNFMPASGNVGFPPPTGSAGEYDLNFNKKTLIKAKQPQP